MNSPAINIVRSVSFSVLFLFSSLSALSEQSQVIISRHHRDTPFGTVGYLTTTDNAVSPPAKDVVVFLGPFGFYSVGSHGFHAGPTRWLGLFAVLVIGLFVYVAIGRRKEKEQVLVT